MCYFYVYRRAPDGRVEYFLSEQFKEVGKVTRYGNRHEIHTLG